MNYFLEKFLDTIKREKILEKNSTILLGISGGSDSISMLRLFLDIREILQLSLFAFHLNHLIRGKEAYDDEDYVKEICQEWDVPLYVERVNIKKMAKNSIENIARDVRLNLLMHYAQKIGTYNIALAHTKDDNIETFLMRFLSGSKSKGLSGIKYIQKFGKYYIIHPLLDFTKEELKKYLISKNIKWREDKTNYETIYLRNKIRLEILPNLKRINPSIEETIINYIKYFSDLNEFIQAFCSDFEKNIEREKRYLKIKLDKVLALSSFLQKEIFHYVFYKYFGKTLKDKQIRSIQRFIRKANYGKVLSILKNVFITKTYEYVLISNKNFYEMKSLDIALSIEKAGVYENELWKIIVSSKKNKGFYPIPYDNYVFRTFKNGDRIKIKSNITKKVKKIFQEYKVPINLRYKLPLVTKDDKIVALFLPEEIIYNFELERKLRKGKKLYIKVIIK